MDDDNVRCISIDPDTRVRNRLGKFAVPCEVSSRWLQFAEHSDLLKLGELVKVDVMTGDHVKPKKLCEMFLRIGDLAAVLQRIKPRNE
jgi:hypothetical protein